MTSNHDFGGEWTRLKLAALRQYLQFYTTALKNQPFRRMYVDAFAGTGNVGEESKDDDGEQLIALPEQKMLAGSARIALDITPSFDRYVFFDTKHEHIASLQDLADEYEQHDIKIERNDANAALQRLAAKTNWRKWRAVVFLDPYGTQVEWKTLEALANTRAVDVWLLVPFGMAYTRMLPSSGDVPEGWARRLTKSFGTDEWKDVAYKESPGNLNLFGEEEVEIRRQKLEDIEKWFVERLETIFPRVSKPIYLKNSNGTWLYSLFFAIANPEPKAQGLALRGANHIINTFGDSRGTD